LRLALFVINFWRKKSKINKLTQLNKIKTKRIIPFFATTMLWSFFVFSIFKLQLVITNNPIFQILSYSFFSYLFVAFYYFNFNKLLPFGKYLASYSTICILVFIFQKLYSSLFLLEFSSQMDSKLIIFFALGLIPIIAFYYIGKLLIRMFK
jgi:hypothetical protein